MDYDKEFSNKKELVDYAETRGVSTEGTRAEITERLVAQDEINAAAEKDEAAEAQAVSESDTPSDAPAEPEAAPAEGAGVITSDTVKVKREAAPEEAAPADEAEEVEGKVLVKMTKRASAHTIGPYRFTRVHPFCLVDKETARRLVEDLSGFRRASAAEAEEYYAD